MKIIILIVVRRFMRHAIAIKLLRGRCNRYHIPYARRNSADWNGAIAPYVCRYYVIIMTAINNYNNNNNIYNTRASATCFVRMNIRHDNACFDGTR